MLLHSWFPLIWYATWQCSEKVKVCFKVSLYFLPLNLACKMTMFWKSLSLTFWPQPQGRGQVGGSMGKIFATMLHMIPFNLICNMTIFWKKWSLTSWPHPQVRLGWGSAGKIFATIWLCCSFSRCHGLICCLWLWYFLIILTYYLCYCFICFVALRPNQQLWSWGWGGAVSHSNHTFSWASLNKQ